MGVEPSRDARYSYGVYLIHPFAIVIAIYLLRGQSVPVRVLGEVVPLLVLPVVAYHVLEHPMIRLGRGWRRKSRRGTSSAKGIPAV